VKLFRLFLIFILLCAGSSAFAFSLGGSFSSSYEISNDKGEDSESLWENYLLIDNAELINPYLGFNFYGRYAQEDDDTYSDVYSAYLEFSSFQKALEIKAGRFSYVGNRFLTLDGIEATFRSDRYFGVTLFGGSPEYFDADDRHINETFRDTGDRLYGAKVFLNGVKNTTGYVSYSKEEDDGDTIQEMLGLSLGRRFNFDKDVYLSTDAKIEYDTEENDIYKGVIRAYIQMHKLRFIGDYTRYNVQDGSSYEEELVISNFSTGEEDRYSFTVQYAVTPNISVYQSTVRSEIEITSGENVTGEIYKLGVDLNYFKTIGVTSNIEGYYYNSEVSNAKGASFILDWNLTKELRLGLESEMLRLENSKTEDTVYSILAEAEYEVIKDLTLSIYGENNQETRYLPENRYGVKAAYSF
jgi:hypothetical protein